MKWKCVEIKIDKQGNWTSINDDIVVFTGDYENENVVLVKSGDEVALIDVGYTKEDALKIKEYIEENNLQVKYLILTHMRYQQLENFLELGKIDKNRKLINPSEDKDDQIISLGDKELKIIYTPGHLGKRHISVEINGDLLVAGDIVTTDENAFTCIKLSDYQGSIESLEKLKDKEYSLIIPGHGEVYEGNSLISETLNTIKEQSQKNTVKQEGIYWTIIDDDIFVSTGRYYMVNLTLVTSGNEATLIDTGNDTKEAEAIKKFIENNNLTLKNIILTHEHPDHYAQLDMFINDNVNLYKYDNSEDNQVIEMGDKNLKIIFTPGHANDKHMSVEVNEEILIAGDIITTNENPLDVMKGNGDDQDFENFEGKGLYCYSSRSWRFMDW